MEPRLSPLAAAIDEPATLFMARRSRELRAQGHDVLAMQVLDPVEVELPTTGDFEFLDVEGGGRLRASADEIRTAHARSVADWRAKLRSASLAAGLRWESVTTAEPLAPVLRRWLEGAGL